MSSTRTPETGRSAPRYYLTIQLTKKISQADAESLQDGGAVVFLLYRNKIASDILRDLEDYIYIPLAEGESQADLVKWVAKKISKSSFQPLGLTRANDVDHLLKHCHSLTDESLQGSTVYRVTQGDTLYGFYVRIIPKESPEDHLYVSPLFGPNKNREYLVAKGSLSKLTDFIVPQEVSYRPVRERMQTKTKHAFVIDGHNLLYRSAFGNYTLFTSDRQTFIGGAVGTYHTILRLCRAHPEYEMHFVFDPDPTVRKLFGFNNLPVDTSGETTGTTVAMRIQSMPEYKANRDRLTPKFYEQLSQNLTWVLHFLKSCGYNVYSHPNHEGDNILGSVVGDIKRQHENYRILIYSTDTDMLQLVDKHTRIYKPKSRAFDYNEYLSEKDVLDMFPVGNVSKVNWARAVIGDKSDNILSAYKWISNELGIRKVLHGKPICDAAARSETLEQYVEEVSKFSDEVRKFMQVKFHDNLKLLTIIEDIPGIKVGTPSAPNPAKMEELLCRIGLHKEIELFHEKVLPALCSYA